MKPLLCALCLLALPVAAAERQIEHGGTLFRIYTVQPSEVELFWQGDDGKPLRQFSALQSHLQGKGRRLAFVMNGGLFEEDGSPCGLLIIDGRTLRSLNTRDGEGNFYLKPNGVFFIDDRGARIVSTEEFARSGPTPRLAIQSGPLLLREGRVHPAFRRDSPNLLHRNGVGIRRDGAVVFAITVFDQPRRVNLYGFAELFRFLGCEDALFLDGDLSQMMAPPPPGIHPGTYFGTIFAVTEEENTPAAQAISH